MSSWKEAVWETAGFIAPVLLVVVMAFVLGVWLFAIRDPSFQGTIYPAQTGTVSHVPEECVAYYVDAERFRIAVPPRHDATDIDLRDVQMMQAYATMYLACVQRGNR